MPGLVASGAFVARLRRAGITVLRDWLSVMAWLPYAAGNAAAAPLTDSAWCSQGTRRHNAHRYLPGLPVGFQWCVVGLRRTARLMGCRVLVVQRSSLGPATGSHVPSGHPARQ